MIATKNPDRIEQFVVVHPMFDVPEQKCDPSELGPMKMSASVKVCLLLLRAYLVLMSVMLCYYFLTQVGVIAVHVAK